MNIWFTSDTHFGHENILSYCNRPFSTIEEHDQIIIENWNKNVKSGDRIYHLGDFGWSSDNLKRLQGETFLIKGNHDSSKITKDKRWSFVKDTYILDDPRAKFFLSHYGHRTWPSMAKGVIHLYGHSHGNLPDYFKSTDVGVDSWNFSPVHIDTLIEKFKDVANIPVSGEY